MAARARHSQTTPRDIVPRGLLPSPTPTDVLAQQLVRGPDHELSYLARTTVERGNHGDRDDGPPGFGTATMRRSPSQERGAAEPRPRANSLLRTRGVSSQSFNQPTRGEGVAPDLRPLGLFARHVRLDGAVVVGA